MNHPTDPTLRPASRGERGSSRTNFIIILLVIAIAAYVAYQIVPITYNASLYKVHMQDTIDKAVAAGKDDAWVKDQLGKTAAEEYSLPQIPRVEIQLAEGRMVVRSRFTHSINFPGYTYQYNFDHTVRSAKFLSE